MGRTIRERNILWALLIAWGIGIWGPGMVGHAEAQVPAPDEARADSLQRPPWMEPSSYRYDPSNRSDPFVPFIRKEEPAAFQSEETQPTRSLTPLEKIEVTQLRAIGILWYPEGEKQTMAMVQLPDGKGFVLHKGMRVGRNNGIVEEITPEAIVVREQGRDILGKPISRDVLIKLHRKQGVQND
jgi:type IV pilus assembly protein PilP